MAREAQHEPARPPVGDVEECVEALLDPEPRVAFQIAPLVVVDEPRGGDRCAVARVEWARSSCISRGVSGRSMAWNS